MLKSDQDGIESSQSRPAGAELAESLKSDQDGIERFINSFLKKTFKKLKSDQDGIERRPHPKLPGFSQLLKSDQDGIERTSKGVHILIKDGDGWNQTKMGLKVEIIFQTR